LFCLSLEKERGERTTISPQTPICFLHRLSSLYECRSSWRERHKTKKEEKKKGDIASFRFLLSTITQLMPCQKKKKKKGNEGEEGEAGEKKRKTACCTKQELPFFLISSKDIDQEREKRGKPKQGLRQQKRKGGGDAQET